MARNTYTLIPTKSNAPMLKIRNADNRNQRRLNKRIDRFMAEHGIDMTRTLRTDSGTLIVYRLTDADVFTVKRDAEREARKTGRKLVTLSA